MDNFTCRYCGEEAYEHEKFKKCKKCDFTGHEDCLEEHFFTKHEMSEYTGDNEVNSDDGADVDIEDLSDLDDYLDGTEQDF